MTQLIEPTDDTNTVDNIDAKKQKEFS